MAEGILMGGGVPGAILTHILGGVVPLKPEA